jgi:hypothetical protein
MFFQTFVLLAAILKLCTFLDITPFSLMEIHRRFGGAYSFHFQRKSRSLGNSAKYLPRARAQMCQCPVTQLFSAVKVASCKTDGCQLMCEQADFRQRSKLIAAQTPPPVPFACLRQTLCRFVRLGQAVPYVLLSA